AAGVWRLRLPTAWDGIPHVNAYAVERDDGVLLVDCGTAGDETCWEALRKALADAGLALADVRLLAATHAHSDHVGLAARVVDETGCAFAMHPDHEHLYAIMREPARYEAARERRARQEGVPDDLLHLYRDVSEEVDGVLAPVEPAVALVPGATLASAAGEWRVVETPGHAPSHVCLYRESDRVLLAGDLVTPVFAPFFDYGFSPDPVAEFLGSLDAVAALEPDVLLPGHGRALERAVLDDHREATQARLEATLRAVRSEPAGGYELTERIHEQPAPPMFRVWQLVEVAGYLRHLRLTGRVVRDELADGRFRHRAA